MRIRRAASLLELLLAMSACTVILTMSAGLIHRIMQVQSKTRVFCDVERTALRLANTFRRDVWQARDATTAAAELNPPAFLRLQLTGDETLEYSRQDGKLLRLLRASSVVRSREEFAFPPGVNFAVDKPTPHLISLSITSRPGEIPGEDGLPRASSFAVAVSFQIQASLGRDGRCVPRAAEEAGQ